MLHTLLTVLAFFLVFVSGLCIIQTTTKPISVTEYQMQRTLAIGMLVGTLGGIGTIAIGLWNYPVFGMIAFPIWGIGAACLYLRLRYPYDKHM